MRMRSVPNRSLLAVASGLFSLLAHAAPLAAQDAAAVLSGRVADGADDPVAGAVVVLHALSDGAGVELDRDTTDARGSFQLRYEHENGPLYFVATRVAGEIFMSEPFRERPTGDLLLLAGAGVEPLRLDGLGAPPGGPGGAPGTARATGATDATGAAGSADAAHGGWWVAVIGTVIIGLVALLLHRGRRRPPRARELMVEIARLDETHASNPANREDGSYRTRRAELRERLTEALELDPDADRH